MSGLENWTSFSLVIGAATLVAAGALHVFVRSQPPGSETMGRASGAVAQGARDLLLEAGRLAGACALPLLVLLAWQGSLAVSAAFAWGLALGAACGGLAFAGVAPACLRTAQGTREVGARWALALALVAGSAAVVGATALASAGAGLLWLGCGGVPGAPLLAGFSLGVSVPALLLRGGGGLVGRAGDVAVDLLERVEPDGAGQGPDNGAAVARDSGDLGGAGVGIPLETLDALVGAAAVGAILGATASGIPALQRGAFTAFPVAVLAAVTLACLGGAVCSLGAHRFSSLRGMRVATFGAPAVFFVAAALLARGYRLPGPAFFSLAVGFAGAVAVGFATGRYASGRGVARVAGASRLGPAQNVIAGFALGLEATLTPVLLLAACLAAAGLLAGLYGVGLAALGAACAAGLAAPLSVAGVIGGQAMKIVEASGPSADTRELAGSVEAEGEVLATVGAGVRTAASALGALAWVGAYGAAAGRGGLDLGHSKVLLGLLVGAVIPFIVCASSLTGVGDVALEIVGGVRRGLRKEKRGETLDKRLGFPVAAGPRKLVAPGLLALAVPVAVGFGFGAEALGGVLAGGASAGILVCLFLLNVGDAWRGTLRRIDAGALGGWGSEAHNAASVGDTLGEPLKDAGVPTIWGVLRLLAAASLLVAPLLA